jgi:SHS2 domain-containing protein
VEIQAGGREAVLAKWLNRLLDMAERNRWAPVECQVSEANDVRLRARVRGVPIPRPPGLRNAVIQLDSISAHGTRGIQAEVSLEAEPAP